jgi:cytochrome c-type biogenesis protein CcmF
LNAGEALLTAAVVSSIATFALAVLRLRSENQQGRWYATSLYITAGMLTANLLFLCYLFLLPDLSYDYVFSHTSTDISLAYRLSGVWSSSAGSLLFMVCLISISMILLLRLDAKRGELTERFRAWSQVIASGLLLIFSLSVIGTQPFRSTDSVPGNDVLQSLYPQGLGLDLELQTWEMVIHPPVVFCAYALALILFSVALASFMTKESAWPRSGLPFARAGWLFLSLGIGIGALWAYYVIGWGGYWSWDPVETASLMAWIVLTAALHTMSRNDLDRSFPKLAPALAILSFEGILFVTFVVRTGGLWSPSSHTFTDGAGADKAEQLLSMLMDQPALGLILIMMIAILFGTIYLAWPRDRPIEQNEVKLVDRIDDRSSMLLAVVILLMSALVLFLLMLKNTGLDQSMNFLEFNQKMAIFLAAILISMIICLSWRRIGSKKAMILALSLVVVSFLVAIAMDISGSSWTVGLVALPAIVSIYVSVQSLVGTAQIVGIKKKVFKAGPQLIHLGVALVVLGFVVSTTMQSVPSSGEVSSVNLGQGLEVGSYEIRLVNLDEHNVTGNPQYDLIREATIDVYRGGVLLESNVTMTDLYLSHGGWPVLVHAEAYVRSTGAEDLYVHFVWEDKGSAALQMKVIPLVSFVWTGTLILCLGILLRSCCTPSRP